MWKWIKTLGTTAEIQDLVSLTTKSLKRVYIFFNHKAKSVDLPLKKPKPWTNSFRHMTWKTLSNITGFWEPN